MSILDETMQLQDVELNQRSHTCLVDHPYEIFSQTTFSLVLLAASYIIVFLACRDTPNYVMHTKNKYTLPNHEYPIDIDLALVHATPNQHFIDVSVEAITTAKTTKPLSSNIVYDQRISHYRDNYKVSNNTNHQMATIKVQNNSRKSERLHFFNTKLNTHDSYHVRTTFESTLDEISSFIFYSSYINPESDKYSHSIRLFAAILVLYFSIKFFKVAKQMNAFDRVFGYIIIISSLLSSDPYGFFKDEGISRISVLLLTISMISIHLYIFIQVSVLKTANTIPDKFTLTLSSIIFGVYFFFQLVSALLYSYCQENHSFGIVNVFTQLLLLCVKAIVLGLLCSFASEGNSNLDNIRRHRYFTFIAIPSAIFEVYWQYSIMKGHQLYHPLFKYSAINMILAALAIFGSFPHETLEYNLVGDENVSILELD